MNNIQKQGEEMIHFDKKNHPCCSLCGSRVDLNENFCVHCGSELCTTEEDRVVDLRARINRGCGRLIAASAVITAINIALIFIRLFHGV